MLSGDFLLEKIIYDDNELLKKFQNVMLILHKLIFHINLVRLRLQQKY